MWFLFLLALLLGGSLIVLLRKPRYARPTARSVVRLIFRLAGMPVTAQGLDNLPDRPHIMLVNHTSFLDEFALTALLPARPGYAFVARQQHAKQSIFCPLLKALGLVLLRNTDSPRRHSNISLLRLALKRGDSLIVFPEGGIVPQEGLGRFHSGAFIAAAAENVPIVVAGIHGARDTLRLGTWLPRRHAIELKIGPVLMPSGKDEQALSRLSGTAHAAMLPLTGERSAEEQWPAPARRTHSLELSQSASGAAAHTEQRDSERTAVGKAGARVSTIMDKPVSTIMHKIVLPVAMDDTVDRVEAMLKSHRISCAPVYSDENGKVLGIITVGDLSRMHAAGRDAGQIKAWEICSYHPVEVTPETPIARVAELMLEHKIHHVIVMQDGSMKGIVSSLDFVKLALDHGN